MILSEIGIKGYKMMQKNERRQTNKQKTTKRCKMMQNKPQRHRKIRNKPQKDERLGKNRLQRDTKQLQRTA